MLKRHLRRLWSRIVRFFSRLAGFLRGNRYTSQHRRYIPSQFEQPIFGNRNVVQNVEGSNNIIVGLVEGSLTINYLRPIDRPFQAPILPANFVHRPEVTVEIKERLLANTSTAGVLLINAIHGLGGIGKTTLVTALAHDEDIQKRFSGGVLWATLGQEPNILSELIKWLQALEGDYKISATNIEAAQAHLQTLLNDKAVLLVVDDAWEPDHVKPFLVGSSQCQILITSRRADVADAVGASLQQLNVMTSNESVALLCRFLEREIEGEEKQEALRVAKAVGYLPIALNLVAARVKRGIEWIKLETALKQEVANLNVLYGPRQENVLEATFNLSLKALREYNEQAWENFIWLGVLPEDITIAAPMAVTLWDMEFQDEANERLELLWNDALIQSDSPVFVGNVEWKGYKIHDLLHDVARSLLIKSQPTGLSFNLFDAHSQLLKRYQQKSQKNLWHTLPNDGYIHQHLVWHLEKAERIEEIHHLLQEESPTGSNGWFEAREKLGQTGGYITDVTRAWELVEKNWTESTLPEIVSLQCRYALMIASVNSLAANLPTKLLIALVKNNVWTSEQGLAYVLQNPEQERKVDLLTKLVDYLPSVDQEIALQKAKETAMAIQDQHFRAFALITLSKKMPGMLPDAVATAREILNQYNFARALCALVDKQPYLLPEALTAARAIQDEDDRADALRALVDKQLCLLPEALTTARAIQDEDYRAYALCALVDKQPCLLPEALTAATAIQDKYYNALALSALAGKQPEVLPQALIAAKAIQDEEDLADALIVLVDKLPPESESLLEEVLTVARTIQNPKVQAEVLSTLSDKLPQVFLEALIKARAIQDEEDCTSVESVLIKTPLEILPVSAANRVIQNNEELVDALAKAKLIQDQEDLANRLIDLANKLPLQLLPEALVMASSIEYKIYRTPVLEALASHISQMHNTDLFPLWQDTLHHLSLRTRSDLLKDIEALALVIFALGGEAATAEVARAIVDVARWWR